MERVSMAACPLECGDKPCEALAKQGDLAALDCADGLNGGEVAPASCFA